MKDKRFPKVYHKMNRCPQPVPHTTDLQNSKNPLHSGMGIGLELSLIKHRLNTFIL